METATNEIGVPLNRNPPPPPPRPGKKPKRRRREWVYKDDYNSLQKRLHNTIAVAYLGWIVLIMYATFDALT